jgi:hypothetical protein
MSIVDMIIIEVGRSVPLKFIWEISTKSDVYTSIERMQINEKYHKNVNNKICDFHSDTIYFCADVR